MASSEQKLAQHYAQITPQAARQHASSAAEQLRSLLENSNTLWKDVMAQTCTVAAELYGDACFTSDQAFGVLFSILGMQLLLVLDHHLTLTATECRAR